MPGSRSDHDVCAKLVVSPVKPDSHHCGARTRDAHRAPLNAADSRFSVRLFIGFDLAFYRWNSRFEATDLSATKCAAVVTTVSVRQQMPPSRPSSFTRSIKA